MSWCTCNDDGCLVHLREKQGSGWYPEPTRRSSQLSVAHDHQWRQQLKENPGEDWAPQPPRERWARKSDKEIVGWKHCFKDNGKDHRSEKVDVGFYSWQIEEKAPLSRKDQKLRKKRGNMRTLLGREESKKHCF